MRVLLDTHVLLWLATTPERTGAALDVLSDPANELLLSAASAWEIVIKHGSGRLPLPDEPESWLSTRLPQLGVAPLAVTWQDATWVSHLPALHRDPFDRLLVAQARRQSLVLATADRLLASYDVEVLGVG